MQPTSLDHVALWVTERDVIADFAVQQLGMHVIERTDRFTLVGWDARRGKLTLFEAEGPRESGALGHIGLRVPGGRDSVELPDGLMLTFVDGDGRPRPRCASLAGSRASGTRVAELRLRACGAAARRGRRRVPRARRGRRA